MVGYARAQPKTSAATLRESFSPSTSGDRRFLQLEHVRPRPRDDPAGTTGKETARYNTIPAALIGRLARHERAKGSGIGELLVADAVKRVLAAAQSVAADAIVVDAKDERGRKFYESPGFISLPSRPNRLFLLAETAAAALAAASKA